jgi:hypothetical protein
MRTESRTPFFSTLTFPLTRLDFGGLRAGGWEPGPAYGSHELFDADSRQQLHPGSELERLLAPEERLHSHREVRSERLDVVASEIVRTTDHWGELAGYLIVHLESRGDTSNNSGMAELGAIARPNTEESTALLRQLGSGVTDQRSSPWEIAEIDRVPTLSLSALGKEGDVGLVRWPGSTPEERRLADLTVLRMNDGKVNRRFPLEVIRPTPSHLLSGSLLSVGVVRIRSLRPDHVVRMRTLWSDAFLLEVVLHHEIRGVARRVRVLAPQGDRATWQEVERRFRTWRTTQVWDRRTDHPMELAIAELARKNFGSDELISRVQSEIDDHATAMAVQQSDRLTRSVLLLTIASLVIPLFLHVASDGGAEWMDWWFLSAAAVAVGVFVAVLQTLLKARR